MYFCRQSSSIELRMDHPECEYPRRRRSARAFSSDERGSGTRDSKIEIVRVAALVLEPWVTATVESRRFQSRLSRDCPPPLAPFSFSYGSNKYRRDRTVLSLFLPLTGSPEFNQGISTLEARGARSCENAGWLILNMRWSNFYADGATERKGGSWTTTGAGASRARFSL